MRPQVVAHRGASYDIAEHTLEAYVEALDVGAEALECDVRLTVDGHLVCVHDRTLRRVAGSDAVVSTSTLDDLKALDFGRWKHPDRPGSVLELRTLLETVRDYDRRVEVAIETKHPTRYGGLVEHKLQAMLEEFGWHRKGAPIRVMSFNPTALLRMERLAPELQLVQLLDHNRNWKFLKPIVRPHWILGPGVKTLRKHPRLAQKITDAGHDLHVWTVNTEEDLQLCLDVGVKAVISDRPGLMLELLS